MNFPTPRFATPRNPERRTFGPGVEVIANRLGTPLMPWQKHVADVALEVDELGRFVYSRILISVPRQAGKTTLTMSMAVHRCLTLRASQVWHTEKTGQDARDKLLECMEIVEKSALGKVFKTNRAAGGTVAKCVNGSRWRPFPPGKDALHGKQSDLVSVDEPWCHDLETGKSIQQAITPTQSTRLLRMNQRPQTIYLSTMGDARSVWWHDMLDAALENPPARTAVFDWGIGPDDDPLDLALVASKHPAVGHTINREFLADALDEMQGDADEFARAFGNRRTTARSRAIPLATWNALRSTELVPAGAPVGFGAAVARDRSRTAIVAAALLEDGTPLVVVIDSRPGTSWAPDRCAELADRYHANDVFAIDRASPSATLWDELDRADVAMLPIVTRDVIAATGDVLDRIRDRRIKFRQDVALDSAADAAVLRRDMRMWDRDKAAAPIPEIEAATLALHALTHLEPADTAPIVRFG